MQAQKVRYLYSERRGQERSGSRWAVFSRAYMIRLMPWLAGTGIAIGHVLTASNCSIPKQGQCSACGSCVVALGSLTAWALFKQHQASVPFYEQNTYTGGK